MKLNPMLKIPVTAIAIMMAGCAPHRQMTENEAAEIARNESVDNLCLASVTAVRFKNVVDNELAARGAICDWPKVQLMMQAREAQAAEQQRLNVIRAQMWQNIGNNMQQMTYKPPIQPVPQRPIFDNPQPAQPMNVNCYTTYSNNQANTHCQ